MDVDELLGRMTLEEKCAQLGGVWYSALLVDGQLDDSRMEQALTHGIGQIARIAGTGFDRLPPPRPSTGYRRSSSTERAWVSRRSLTRRPCPG